MPLDIPLLFALNKFRFQVDSCSAKKVTVTNPIQND
jgi:hypothetical protein